jgi:hypothetical protein
MIEIEGLRKTFRARVGGGPWWRARVGGGQERTAVALDGLSLAVPAGGSCSPLGAVVLALWAAALVLVRAVLDRARRPGRLGMS